MTIIFKDPPPRNRGPINPHSFWVGHLAPLKDRPGQWAAVKTTTPSYANSCAARLRSGVLGRGLNTAEWEFAARSEDGVGTIYARFIGGDQ